MVLKKRQFLKDGVWTVDLSENCHILNNTIKFSYIALACLRNDILKLDYVYSSKNKFVYLICFFFPYKSEELLFAHRSITSKVQSICALDLDLRLILKTPYKEEESLGMETIEF